MVRVLAVCVSENRGTPKRDVGACRLVKGKGLEGDAHAGSGHRQVSLLARESADKMRQKGVTINHGDFGENLTTEGIDLKNLPVGARLRAGRQAILRVTQIGKECHDHCAIYEQIGDCIMPREGIFAEVLQEGTVRTGDEIVRLTKDAQDEAKKTSEDEDDDEEDD